MPIHDWNRVLPGTFHDFHCAWITHLKELLNSEVLPADYFALAEQHAGETIPDILTLSHVDRQAPSTDSGGLAVEEAPPKVSLCMTADESIAYRALRRTIAIRHRTGHDLVAMIEILSPGNKSGRSAVDQFVAKSASAIRLGIHLLVIDLFPPTSFDPQGMHGEIWAQVGGQFQLPPNQPLLFAAYEAVERPRAYVEPSAVGHELPLMPVFLAPARYVNAPLARSYAAAYNGMPRLYHDILEGRAPAEG